MHFDGCRDDLACDGVETMPWLHAAQVSKARAARADRPIREIHETSGDYCDVRPARADQKLRWSPLLRGGTHARHKHRRGAGERRRAANLSTFVGLDRTRTPLVARFTAVLRWSPCSAQIPLRSRG